MTPNESSGRRPQRLLFINRCYGPGEATGQLLAELCEDLAQIYDVTVIAGQPNSPTAEPLPGRDVVRGVTVIRVRSRRFRKSSLWSRAAGLGIYMGWSALAALRQPKPDALVVESDPPMLGMLGAILRRWHGCKLVNYLQDLFPEVGLALGRLKPGLVTKTLHIMTQVGLHTADRVVVLGEDMKRRVEGRGVPGEKIAVVSNWSDTRIIRPQPPSEALRKAWGLDGRFVVMYSGNLGLSQSLEQVIAAAELLRDEPVTFLFVGEGALRNRLKDDADRRGLTNVRFEPYQPKERLAESLSVADVHLVTLHAGLAGYIVPSKLYGILAAGRPYVAAVDEASEVAAITAEAGCGVRVNPDDPAALAAAVRACMADREHLALMGRRGRELAVARFDRGAAVAAFGQVLEGVVAEAAPYPAGAVLVRQKAVL